MTLGNRESFEKIYRYEQDVKTKERMLLVLNLVYQGKIAAQVAKDLYRSKSWASDWLKRYNKEGIEGLKTRPKSGRPAEIPEEIGYHIRKELKESKRLDHKTGERVNYKGKRHQISLHPHISYPSKMGFQTKSTKKGMLILSLRRKKRHSKKGHPNTCGHTATT